MDNLTKHKRAKYGDVYFSIIEDEEPTDSVRISDKAVEDGQPLVDHVQAEASTIRIQGMIVGDNASEQLQLLKSYMYNAERHTFIGRNIYSDMLIESIPRKHTRKISNGFEFTISLINAKIATTKTFTFKNSVNPTTKNKDVTIKTKTKAVTNSGRKPIKKTESKAKTNTPRRRTVVERKDYQLNELKKNTSSPAGTMKVISGLY